MLRCWGRSDGWRCAAGHESQAISVDATARGDSEVVGVMAGEAAAAQAPDRSTGGSRAGPWEHVEVRVSDMPSYKTKAIVLKKTKLKEKDLILTLLGENGEQIRAVAKGAQKPGSTFSARLEVFSVVDLMLYKGRNLDTVTDVRTIATNGACRTDVVRLSYGAVMAELVEKTALEGQEMPVTYPLMATALESLGRADEVVLPFVTAAFLIKLIAYLGYKPSFDECTMCGRPREGALAGGAGQGSRTFGTGGAAALDIGGNGDGATEGPEGPEGGNGPARSDGTCLEGTFSISSGGWVCGECAQVSELGYDDLVDVNVAGWVKTLMSLRFSEIEEMLASGEGGSAGMDALAGEVLDFCERWVGVHLGIRLKSLGFLSRLHI